MPRGWPSPRRNRRSQPRSSNPPGPTDPHPDPRGGLRRDTRRNETPDERLKRFRAAAGDAFGTTPRPSMLEGRAFRIAREDFPAARRLRSAIWPRTHPLARSLPRSWRHRAGRRLKKKKKKNLGRPDRAGAWLARGRDGLARGRNMDFAPYCGLMSMTKCSGPVCANCESFDTLSWEEGAAIRGSPCRPGADATADRRCFGRQKQRGSSENADTVEVEGRCRLKGTAPRNHAFAGRHRERRGTRAGGGRPIGSKTQKASFPSCRGPRPVAKRGRRCRRNSRKWRRKRGIGG